MKYIEGFDTLLYKCKVNFEKNAKKYRIIRYLY
jgi:hypothetical protein